MNKINTTPKPEEPKEKSCCGGSPQSNENACCKADEEAKAQGEQGCGCNCSEK